MQCILLGEPNDVGGYHLQMPIKKSDFKGIV